jgi:hypothetical protein
MPHDRERLSAAAVGVVTVVVTTIVMQVLIRLLWP